MQEHSSAADRQLVQLGFVARGAERRDDICSMYVQRPLRSDCGHEARQQPACADAVLMRSVREDAINFSSVLSFFLPFYYRFSYSFFSLIRNFF